MSMKLTAMASGPVFHDCSIVVSTSPRWQILPVGTTQRRVLSSGCSDRAAISAWLPGRTARPIEMQGCIVGARQIPSGGVHGPELAYPTGTDHAGMSVRVDVVTSSPGSGKCRPQSLRLRGNEARSADRFGVPNGSRLQSPGESIPRANGHPASSLTMPAASLRRAR